MQEVAMTTERQPSALAPEAQAPQSAEEKRLAARRRFLSRGAAGGSGLLVVTLGHQRAFAQRPPLRTEPNANGNANKTPPPGQQEEYKPQGMLVSSSLACSSIQGTPVATVTVLDDDLRNKVEKVDCVRR
jgi:hypothetical protein